MVRFCYKSVLMVERAKIPKNFIKVTRAYGILISYLFTLIVYYNLLHILKIFLTLTRDLDYS